MGKQMFNFTGMSRDIDSQKSSSNFAFEIRNLRIANHEDGETLCLTTEKGNEEYSLIDENNVSTTLSGNIIGYGTVGEYMVLFTTQGQTDRIYRLERTTTDLVLKCVLLYQGILGFSEEGVLIDTKGNYESDIIQKIYWIDGVHQPRVINVVADQEERNRWASVFNPFDFQQALSLNEDITIEKIQNIGLFRAGTIQYVCTYYNHNGTQSKPFYISPIHYISPTERGAAADEDVQNAFKISIQNPNTNWDFIRIYAIQRTSKNGTPICRKIADLETSNYTLVSDLEYTFNNYTFPSGDPDDTTQMELFIWPNLPSHLEPGQQPSIVKQLNSNRENNDEFISIPGYVPPTSNYVKYYTNEHTSVDVNQNSGYRTYLKTGNIYNNIEEVIAFIGNYEQDAQIQLTIDYIENDYHDNLINASLEYGYFTIQEIPNSIKELSIIDTGLIGESVDYDEILYAGGLNIIPNTFEQKNNTLFFGNYKYGNRILTQSDIDTITSGVRVQYKHGDRVSKGSIGSYYIYENQLSLSEKEITGFKGGETYRFGIVLFDSNGNNTSVIDLGEFKNNYYPNDTIEYYNPVKAVINLTPEALQLIKQLGFTHYRTVFKPSEVPDVAYQGALCPTLYRPKDRAEGKLYSQSSWFFRDIRLDDNTADGNYSTEALWLGKRISDNVWETGTSNDYEHWPAGWSNATHTNITFITNLIHNHKYKRVQNIHNQVICNRYNIDKYNFVKQSYNINTGKDDLYDYDTDIDPNKIIIIDDSTIGEAIHDFFMDGEVIGAIGYEQTANNPSICNNNYLDFGQLHDSDFYIDWNTITLNTPESDFIYPLSKDLRIIGLIPINGNDNDNLKTIAADSLYKNIYISHYGPAQLKHNISSINGNAIMLSEFSWYEQFVNIFEDFDYVEDHGVVNYNLKKFNVKENNSLFDGYTQGYSFSLLFPWHRTTSYTNQKGIIIGTDDTSDLDDINLIYDKPGFNVTSNIRVSSNTLFINHHEQQKEYDINPIKIIDDTDILHKLNITDNKYYKANYQNAILNLEDYYNYSFIDGTYISNPSVRAYFLYEHKLNDAISLKYKSTSHIVCTLPTTENDQQTTLPYISGYGTSPIPFTLGKMPDSNFKPTWMYENCSAQVMYDDYIANRSGIPNNGIDRSTIKQDVIHLEDCGFSMHTNIDDLKNYGYIYLAELVKPHTEIQKDGVWYYSSELSKFLDNEYQTLGLYYGDTYYQRYDCLKTYPYTLEDQNQIVEILSFMCETRDNIDGRYDKRRGIPDLTATNTNFNLINQAYTQLDNFFTAQWLDIRFFTNSFSNQIIWTQTKTNGEIIDSWTKIIPTSILDMDGVYGNIESLNIFNDNLLCFQESAIARINYNDRVALTTQNGVPVTIANSNKVDGKTYLSTQIGTSNKESVQITPNGVYFIDANKREIFFFGGEAPFSLSAKNSINSYFFNKDVDILNIRTTYDPVLKDVYFRIDIKEGNTTRREYLIYSEKLTTFTSFIDYNTPYIFPFKDKLLSTKNNSLYEQFAGDYLTFFEETKPYSIEFVSNENGTLTKTFTNIEFIADVLDDKTLKISTDDDTYLRASINETPFDNIHVWNEYQNSGDVELQKMIRKGVNMSQKFRVWRADIPRDSAYILDRMSNPWLRIRLSNNELSVLKKKNKTYIHHIGVSYL